MQLRTVYDSTMTDTLLERTHAETAERSPIVAHIVHPYAAFVEALVNGTEVTALCGYRWVPTRDGGGLPVCAPCLREKSELQAGRSGEAA